MGCCSKDSIKVESPKKKILEYKQNESKKECINYNNISVSTVTLSDGSVYTGTMLDNKLHGRGVLKYVNGDVYEGEFSNGKKEGKGKWTDKEGNSYDGYWKEDRKHGEGVYKTFDGLIFEGSFNNNKKEGKATITTPEKTKYICTFENDEEVGEAEFFFANGDHALGFIKDGNLDKNGRYEFKNGDIYVGNFKNGLFHGKGYYKWNSNSSFKIYEGEYIEGSRNGNGQLINIDGRILRGKFKNNNLDGEVLEISPQGNQVKVLFDNGKYVKIIDKITEKLNVNEIMQESTIITSIFSDPDFYKKSYQNEQKNRAKLKIQIKKSKDKKESLPIT
ncbi:conserved Plasmodium protein, unknown function [Plasmodium relictum]|uniref:MORN repeat protein n=1 Tax=Plasmodium relictum TaxID=85471 RepID=A0A1J1H9K4_PLARL|nr:conserved Plasmodium protein, unknown function [Plasmodium relictum]CRH01310.1 conserved Plasmodium protein, unknown function [Plasmodium relictum]